MLFLCQSQGVDSAIETQSDQTPLIIQSCVNSIGLPTALAPGIYFSLWVRSGLSINRQEMV